MSAIHRTFYVSRYWPFIHREPKMGPGGYKVFLQTDDVTAFVIQVPCSWTLADMQADGWEAVRDSLIDNICDCYADALEAAEQDYL